MSDINECARNKLIAKIDELAKDFRVKTSAAVIDIDEAESADEILSALTFLISEMGGYPAIV